MEPIEPTIGKSEAFVKLREEVAAWIANDPDPVTRRRLEHLMTVHSSAGAIEAIDLELADAFSGPLQFGTAGLRGKMGAGPNRMNRAVVIRAAAGLAAFLNEARAGAKPRVVIGYDARHYSHTFATDSAAVMTAAGLNVALLPGPLPTPVLAFAVRHLSADAGVMVTASHNPAQDNGYKVYLGGEVAQDDAQGVQIVAPFDAQIAEKITQAAPAAEVPRADEGWQVLGPDIVTHYVESVTRLATASDDLSTPRDLRIVYTPLHGVGNKTAHRIFAAAGYHDVFSVPLQAEPDPEFPTVGFPNPEEAGAIDLALFHAQERDADIVIANDPDADRCALALRDHHLRHAPDLEGGTVNEDWRMLHGDEVGALLGEMIGRNAARMRIAPGTLSMANSIVSSRLLGKIAARHGLAHTTTLTGFKWIARTEGLIYGYEEALGYCVDPMSVRDKDGISAALMLIQLADELKAKGRTLLDALDDLAREHGLFVSDQLAARFTDLQQIPKTMEKLRAQPPSDLAGSEIVSVVDLNDGYEGLPPTDGLLLLAADDTRVVVRPSGTEPKVKCYLEVVLPVDAQASTADMTAARQEARKRLDAVRAQLSKMLGLPH